MPIDSPRAPPLPTRRSFHCYSCRYSFDITTTFTSTPTNTLTLVCPSCHQQRFVVHLTFSFPTTTPPRTTATATSAVVQAENAVSRENQGARTVRSRTKLTSKSFLKSLPWVRITEVDLKESSCCSICMEDFVFGGSADKLPCKHLFHKSCIVEWLSRSNTCPLCRFKMPLEARTPVSTRWENNLDGLRVSSSVSGGVIRTGRGFIGAGSNTIGRGVGGNSNMDIGSLGSNTNLDVMVDDDGDTIMIEDVQRYRDVDGDTIMADA